MSQLFSLAVFTDSPIKHEFTVDADKWDLTSYETCKFLARNLQVFFKPILFTFSEFCILFLKICDDNDSKLNNYTFALSLVIIVKQTK